MSTHSIHFQDKIIDLKLSKLYYHIYSYGKSFYGLKNQVEIAVVNEPSVFEPPKVYCRMVAELKELLRELTDRQEKRKGLTLVCNTLTNHPFNLR